MGALCRIRVTAAGMCVAILAASAPLSLWAHHAVCTARSHGCDAPKIAACCCPEAAAQDASSTAPGRTAGGGIPAPALGVMAVAPTPAVLTAQAPPQSWLRGVVHRAGPPRSLPILHSAFLI
jgi:hypothetical protein